MKPYSIVLITLILFSCSNSNKQENFMPPIELSEKTEYYELNNLPSDLTIVRTLTIDRSEGGGALEKLPFVITKMTNLEHLSINWAGLKDLTGIENLVKLRYLNLVGNSLFHLDGVDKLIQLEYLDIGCNPMKELPIEIRYLPNLKEFNLYWTNIETFPDWFYSSSIPIENLCMTSLFDFDYKSNFPKMHQLKNLKELRIGHFQLKLPSLDIEFEKCTNLEKFGFCSRNKIEITKFINNVSKAPKLRVLYLGGNHITFLPREIFKLSNLEELRVRNNQIKRLPLEITQLLKLKKIDVNDNPIDTMAIKQIEKAMPNTTFYYGNNR